MADKQMKVAVIWGPPGCGKNALIKSYCLENNIELIKYTEWK